MGTHWIRQEVKRNPLAERIDKALAWIKSHREASAATAVISLVCVILVMFFVSRYAEVKNTAWEKLFIAQQYAYSGHAEALNQLHAVRDAFPNTDAAGFGLLFEGDILFKQGKYKEAGEDYQSLAEKGKPAAVIPFALAGKGKALEASGLCPEAILTGKQFLEKYPDHYLAPEVHLSIARCFEITDNAQEARSAYEKIALLFPDTSWAQTAQQKLQSLPKQQPSQTPPGAGPPGAKTGAD